MNIEELAEDIKSQVGLMVENEDELEPILFVVSGNELSLVGFEANEQVKERWQTLLPQILRRLNATAYIMVIEAWRSNLSQDSPLTERLQTGELSVSQLAPDDKEEVAQVLAVENGKSVQCWHAKIERIADRRFITGWDGMSGDMKMTGRMIVTEW